MLETHSSSALNASPKATFISSEDSYSTPVREAYAEKMPITVTTSQTTESVNKPTPIVVTKAQENQQLQNGKPHPQAKLVVNRQSLRLSASQNNSLPPVCFGKPPAPVHHSCSVGNAAPLDSPYIQLEQHIQEILSRLSELERGHETLRQEQVQRLSVQQSQCSMADAQSLINPQDAIPREEVDALIAEWRERAEHLEMEKSILLDQVQEARLRAEQAVLDGRIEVVNPTHPKVVALTNSIRTQAKLREQDLQSQIELLQQANAQLQIQISQVSSTDLAAEKSVHKEIAESFAAQIEILKNDLREADAANNLLQQQNVELTKRIQSSSKSSDASQPKNMDMLSWEELKEAWIAQIENEAAVLGEPRVLEIQDIIRSSEAEIDRRDLEIAELRHLLSEQSCAAQGIAVGAAAIAAELDQNELVREERERLAALQEEWDQKQRLMEIEMSLERAKLARERLQLQETIREIEVVQMDTQYSRDSSPGAETVADLKPRGRWLHHLGLHNHS